MKQQPEVEDTVHMLSLPFSGAVWFPGLAGMNYSLIGAINTYMYYSLLVHVSTHHHTFVAKAVYMYFVVCTHFYYVYYDHIVGTCFLRCTVV